MPTTIHDLSDDVLLVIFLHYVQSFDFDAPRSYHDASFSPYAFIRITFICRRWRHLALQDPFLWTSISVTDRVECLDAVAKRSQQTGLSVTLENWRGRDQKSISFVTEQKERIRHLHLRAYREAFSGMEPCLGNPLPELRTLKLTYDVEDITGPGYPNLSIDGILKNTPKLHTMDVTSCGLYSMDEQLYSPPPDQDQKISHVRMRSPGKSLIRPTVNEFVLAYFQNVTTLYLSYVVVFYEDGPDQFSLSFPRLQQLELHDMSPHRLPYILYPMTFPSSATLRITCGFHGGVGMYRYFREFSNAISRKLRDSTLRPVRTEPILSLIVSIDYLFDQVVLNASSVDEVSFDASRAHTDLQITLIAHNDSTQWTEWCYGELLTNICPYLPLAEVTTVCLDISSPCLQFLEALESKTDLWGALRSMTKVRTLAIRDAPVRDVVELLLCPIVYGKEQFERMLEAAEVTAEDAKPLFPILEHLHLDTVDFAADSESKDAGFSVRSLLERREKESMPIRRLTLANCTGVSDEIVKDLREVVELVVQ
ncbi:hypothetical protein EIP91_005187 [Steccherinum ochraceum]|uniref:Uncharacterized protein n=1 Tax=Steccherinum ochraceum TaxID=92696 RepID=A0A4R0RIJ6_9APHY|nr:hypothetical protein EIP91_005187 [Steccherinum ochraceum]